MLEVCGALRCSLALQPCVAALQLAFGARGCSLAPCRSLSSLPSNSQGLMANKAHWAGLTIRTAFQLHVHLVKVSEPFSIPTDVRSSLCLRQLDKSVPTQCHKVVPILDAVPDPRHASGAAQCIGVSYPGRKDIRWPRLGRSIGV